MIVDLDKVLKIKVGVHQLAAVAMFAAIIGWPAAVITLGFWAPLIVREAQNRRWITKNKPEETK